MAERHVQQTSHDRDAFAVQFGIVIIGLVIGFSAVALLMHQIL